LLLNYIRIYHPSEIVPTALKILFTEPRYSERTRHHSFLSHNLWAKWRFLKWSPKTSVSRKMARVYLSKTPWIL